MADPQIPGPQPQNLQPGSRAWRKRVAILVAVALAAAGLLLLEHGPAASAAPGPRVVLSTSHHVSATSSVDAQVAQIKAVTAQLKGAASLLTQTLPDLDAETAVSTVDVASSAGRAAVLSQRLATVTAARRVDPDQASSTASQLRAALATTQAKSVAVSSGLFFRLRFCNFTIQIGPIIISIPRLHIYIVIGPFFIHFRAPCFLSGRIPTHIP